MYRAMFDSVESIATVMKAAVELGFSALYCHAKEREVQAIMSVKEAHGDITCLALVPDFYEAMDRQTKADEGRSDSSTWKLKHMVRSLPAVVKAGATGDLVPLARQVLSDELDLVSPTEPRFVVLHAMMTDMACALEKADLLRMFQEAVREMGAVPGLATHNLPFCYEKCAEMGLEFPLWTAPVNPNGFMMNPSEEACLQVFRDAGEIVFLGKKVLAGGVVPPLDAFRYAFEHAGIDCVSVGIATAEEAREAIEAARGVLGENWTAGVEVV